ncbi:hypothetical protein GHK56_19535 [Sinorhizobium meliloti]|nr:hypothetical protein [Sinorhizobium meliloti]
MSKRELIDTGPDKRYVRRNGSGKLSSMNRETCISRRFGVLVVGGEIPFHLICSRIC